jgi:hypothetical protein
MASYRFFYKEDLPLIKPLLLNLEKTTYPFKNTPLTISPCERPKTLSAQAAQKKWDKIKWFHLSLYAAYRGYRSSTYIAEITLPNNKRFVIFRNGNNLTTHNFLIFDCNNETYYFRQNFSRAHLIIDILGGPKNQLPLFLGMNEDKLVTTILQEMP